MKLKSTKFIALVIAALTGITAVTALGSTTPVLAEDICSSSASAEVKAAAGCSGTGTSAQLPYTVRNILYAIIGVAGLVAVIFVIVGGVSYMTSQGDPGKLQKAKNTILYAVIGLIICALAFAIVSFVIDNIIKAPTPTS